MSGCVCPSRWQCLRMLIATLANPFSIQQIGKVSKKKKTLIDGFKHALHIKIDDRSTEDKSQNMQRKAEGKPMRTSSEEHDAPAGSDESDGPSFEDFKKRVFYGCDGMDPQSALVLSCRLTGV